MTVTVTERHIAAGAPRQACGCPVARAVAEALPGARVAVWADRVVVDGRPFYLPRALGEWVAAFDRGAAVGPIAVELPIEVFAERPGGDVTTEGDFQSALDANRDDHHTRLVFADWLQDRDDPRAEGYRALGRLRRVPFHGGERTYWAYWITSSHEPSVLPVDWWNEWRGLILALLKLRPDVRAWELPANTLPFRRDTRRGAEDLAALAFARLPAGRRAELLDPEPVAAAT